MTRRSRSRAPKQTEGTTFETLPPDQSFTAVLVGFGQHWRDLNGDGKKQQTGRINIRWWETSFDKEAYEFGHGDAFTVFIEFIVILGEHAGERMGRAVNLKPIVTDPLGQSWYWDLGPTSDSQFVHTFTRIMRAAGLEIEPDQEPPWAADANQYIGLVTGENSYLELPEPTQEEAKKYFEDLLPEAATDQSKYPWLQEVTMDTLKESGMVGSDGTYITLPGLTPELVLMGIEWVIVNRLPIVTFSTYTAKSGRVKIGHDSIKAVGPAEEQIFRAEMAKNDAVVEAVNRQTHARMNGVITPLQDSTPGMWLYKVRNDLADMPIPFESLPDDEEPEQVVAKEAMWDFTKRLYTKATTEEREQLVIELSDKYSLNLSEKQKITDLPWPRACAAFVTVVGIIGHPDIRLRQDELTVLQDAGATIPSAALPRQDDGGLPEELA